MVGRLRASSPAGGEPKSCYSIYPTSEKLKNQQLYLDPSEKWGHQKKTTAPKIRDTERQNQGITADQSRTLWTETSVGTSVWAGNNELLEA